MQQDHCTSVVSSGQSPVSSSGSGERPSPGLVNAHISRRGGRLPAVGIVLPGGMALKQVLPPREQEGGGARGVIRGFSAEARRRMLRFLASVVWAGNAAHFVTLTYHTSPGPKPGKAHLDAWRKRLERHYGERVRGVIWKQEYQQRGVVHYHLVLFWRQAEDVPDISSLRRWVAGSWNEVAEPGDLQHLRAGTSVDQVRNTSGPLMGRLMRYLGKYLGKSFQLLGEDGEALETGRVWGKWGDVPTAVYDAFRMGYEAWVELTRRIRRWGRESRYLRGVSSAWQGCLVLADGHLLEQLVRGLELEHDVGEVGV